MIWAGSVGRTIFVSAFPVGAIVWSIGALAVVAGTSGWTIGAGAGRPGLAIALFLDCRFDYRCFGRGGRGYHVGYRWFGRADGDYRLDYRCFGRGGRDYRLDYRVCGRSGRD